MEIKKIEASSLEGCTIDIYEEDRRRRSAFDSVLGAIASILEDAGQKLRVPLITQKMNLTVGA